MQSMTMMNPCNFTKVRIWIVVGGQTLFVRDIVCKGEVSLLICIGLGVMFDIIVGEMRQKLLFRHSYSMWDTKCHGLILIKI